MKQLFLLALCSVAALFSVNSVNAQNPHYLSGPCISSDGRTISGVVAGLGEGGITVVCSGQSDCINPANQRPPAWQDFSISQNVFKTRGGNYSFSVNISANCNRRWTFETTGLEVTIWYAVGNKSYGPTSVGSCQ